MLGGNRTTTKRRENISELTDWRTCVGQRKPFLAAFHIFFHKDHFNIFMTPWLCSLVELWETKFCCLWLILHATGFILSIQHPKTVANEVLSVETCNLRPSTHKADGLLSPIRYVQCSNIRASTFPLSIIFFIVHLFQSSLKSQIIFQWHICHSKCDNSTFLVVIFINSSTNTTWMIFKDLQTMLPPFLLAAWISSDHLARRRSDSNVCHLWAMTYTPTTAAL